MRDGAEASIAVLAEDVTLEVEEGVRAELFLKLLGDLAASVDPRTAVSAVIARTRDALGATAASLFLVEPGGDQLRGAPGEWDWTRTSFRLSLSDWPNVRNALVNGAPVYVTASEARGAEAGWFEARGIGGTLCIPLQTNGRSIGVLFFDFSAAHANLDGAATKFAQSVAIECGRALDRALGREDEILSRSLSERAVQDGDRLIDNVAARLEGFLEEVVTRMQELQAAAALEAHVFESMRELDRAVAAQRELLRAIREHQGARAADIAESQTANSTATAGRERVPGGG